MAQEDWLADLQMAFVAEQVIGTAQASDRNCLTAKDHAVRDASGPCLSLKGLPAAPPLHAWASLSRAISVATVLDLHLKSVTDIG